MEAIFKKITKSERRDKIEQIVRERVLIAVKAKSDQVYYVQPDSHGLVAKKDILICDPREEMSLPLSDSEFICNFSLGEDRYFFQAMGKYYNHQLILECPEEFYLLQRRRYVRISLPSDYAGVFMISDHRDRDVNLHARVVDYSSGGLKVAVVNPDPNLQPGDTLKGVLRLGSRPEIKLTAIIRHKMPVDVKSKEQVLGVQFMMVDMSTESKLMSFTLDLHRELMNREARSKKKKK